MGSWVSLRSSRRPIRLERMDMYAIAEVELMKSPVGRAGFEAVVGLLVAAADEVAKGIQGLLLGGSWLEAIMRSILSSLLDH